MKSGFTLLIHFLILLLILAWSPTANCATLEPRLLKDINTTASNASSNPFGFVSSGAFTYFIATNGIGGQGLWKSNGTEAGTVLVKDIYPGVVGSYPGCLINVNGILYFKANDGTNGDELWKSDGTASGTVMVKDINPGASSSTPLYLTNLRGTLYFSANDGTNGIELWKSDGTETGTVMVKDILPGSGPSSPQHIINFNDLLFFSAQETTHGYELWKSDGTEAGTVLMKDINPGNGISSPGGFINLNGTLYFGAYNPTTGNALWKSDGTEAGTVLVKNISAGSLISVNSTLYFTATNGTTGVELWKSDGTETGTELVKDIYPGAGHAYPSYLTDVNGILYFRADDGTNGLELWKSDGTEAGTVLVKDINPGMGSSNPEYLTNVNNTLYFIANNGVSGRELWMSDGTAEGTVLVKDFYPGSRSSNPANLTNVNGILYFAATDPTHGTELWVLAPQTIAIPSITTGTPSSVGITTATLNGTVSDGGADTTVSFEYGIDTNYGNSVSAGTVTANSGVSPVNVLINGLVCGTPYHYRIVATNSAGTSYGSDNQLFTYLCPMAPSVSTSAASAISTTGVTLNGYAYTGGTITTVTFDYGQTSDYGSTIDASQSPLAENGGGAVSVAITALACGTTYHFRINGQNSIGITSSQDTTFTTTDCPPAGSSIITTIAGNGTPGFAVDEGAATSASFYYPYDVALDSSGNIYIADTLNYRIRKLTINTGIISTIAGNGSHGLSGDDGPATTAKISAPYGVTVDSTGNIYIADNHNHLIRKVDAASGIITTVAGHYSYPGTGAYSGDGGLATSASLNNPRKVAVDNAGNIYIADTDNNRIRMVDASTGIITTVAGNGTGAFAGDGGSATSASLYWPHSVAVDNFGNIYIADYMNLRIRKVEKATGIISTVAGKSGTGLITYTGEGGPATSAQISTPYGVTVDSDGNIYIAASYRILKVDAVTGILDTVAGNGVGGFSGDGGSATTASLNVPTGTAIDPAGNIHFADTYNHRIRKVTPAYRTMTITPVANGTISGPITATYGSSANYTITPATGYHVADVLVDGASVGAVTAYSFSNVTTNHTISATFAINTFAITATAGASGSISGPATVNYGSNAVIAVGIPVT